MARRSTARSYCCTSSSNAAVLPCWAWRISAESSTRIGVLPLVCFTGPSIGLLTYGVTGILLICGTIISVLANKLVPRSMHSQDEARLLRLRFHLLPQPDDVRIDGARSRKAVISPDILEQPIAAQSLAGMAQKIFQQLELLGREIHCLATTRHLATFQIYFNLAEGIILLVLGQTLGAAQYRFHPRQEFAQGPGELFLRRG